MPELAAAAIVWLGHVPVMVMFDPCTKLGVAVAVPPFATGRIPDTSVVNTTGLLTIFTKSEPFHATKARTPEATVTPVVGPEPRITIEPVPALMTK